MLKSSGQYVTIAGDVQGPISVGRILSTAAARINRGFWSCFTDPTYHDMLTAPGAADLDRITAMLERGAVRVRTDSEHAFQLDAVVAAFERMASQRAKGKVVIVVHADEE